jgi:hypothetical protein
VHEELQVLYYKRSAGRCQTFLKFHLLVTRVRKWPHELTRQNLHYSFNFKPSKECANNGSLEIQLLLKGLDGQAYKVALNLCGPKRVLPGLFGVNVTDDLQWISFFVESESLRVGGIRLWLVFQRLFSTAKQALNELLDDDSVRAVRVRERSHSNVIVHVQEQVAMGRLTVSTSSSDFLNRQEC